MSGRGEERRRWLPALRAAAGERAVREGALHLVDDAEIDVVVAPADGESLSAALAVLCESGVSTVVCGGGSRLHVGNLPRAPQLLLSTRELAGIDVFDVDEGVVQVRGGTAVRALREAVRAEGWELPLDPWSEDSSVGGALAAADIGPRTQGFGPVRGCALGLDVSLASGARTRCGGRVVKNVTGYDLAKLYTGSFGSLGVIEGAWLRLRPCAEEAVVYRVALPDAALAPALDAARRPTARVAALVGGAAVGWRLVVELAGDAAAVARDEGWLAARFGEAASVSADAADGEARIGELRDAQAGRVSVGGVRVRVAALPSALAGVLEALTPSARGVCAHPGLGLAYLDLGPFADAPAESSPDAAERAGLEEALGRVMAVVRGVDGSAVFEHLPTWAKSGRDVFGEVGPSLVLMRGLKDRFDPAGILNPGRFAGHL